MVFAFLGLAAKASVVYFDSSALTTANNSGFGTVDLTGVPNPNPQWAPALPDSDWISYGPTGDPSDPGYFVPVDGTVVTFTTLFILSGTVTDGTLTVLADDSTSVILNGQTILGTELTPGPQSTEEIFTFPELAPYLVNGANELSFGVVEVGANSFGLDFSGNLDPGETPEPATVAFIGVGLIALVLWRRRK